MKIPVREKLKDGLKRARKEHGYTQQALANELCVSVETIRKWEHGKIIPPGERLYDLCNLYQCDTNYLTGVNDCTTQDLQGIHDYTGLSQDTITALTGLDDVIKDMLHKMATVDNGDILKLLLDSMFLYCGGHIQDLKAFNIYGEEIHLDTETKAEMTKFEAVDTYSMILHRLYNQYHDYRMDVLKNKIDAMQSEIKLMHIKEQLQGVKPE